ncbi:MAG TPA: non-canonical purine NTP phosphatase, partial [Alteromonas australica]|nr:non-canonical purine NTP phosphatase [Alteromonas australica]
MISYLYVGSQNPVKVNAALETLSDTLDEAFEVEGISVPSGVSEQPMTEEETREGAINRVKALLSLHGGGETEAWYVAI